jgi:hypothetical protein
MRHPRTLLPLLALSASAAACGSAAAPVGVPPALIAVNGASAPAVVTGDTAFWTGIGFGPDSLAGVVLVPGSGGFLHAEILDWADDAVEAVLPADAASGSSYVVAGGDTLGPIDLFVQPRTSFLPGATAWTQAAALRRGLGGAAAGALLFMVGGEVHALAVLTGGRLADGSLNDSTYLGTVNGDGLITEWHTAPDSLVPQARYLHVVLGAHRLNARLGLDGVVYQIGGIDSAGNVLTDVLGIGITTSGSYTLWTPLAVLPTPRAGAAGAVAFGTLYIIGGFGPDSLASRSVLTANVDSAGRLSGWFVGPSLPDGLAFAAAAVAGHTLYVTGGERGLVDPDTVSDSSAVSSAVLAIRLSPKTGAFLDTAWTVLTTSLAHARSRHAAFAMDGALVVTGGIYVGLPSAAESEYAVVDSTGALAAFQDLPPPTVADLAGAPAWLSGGPPIWDARGQARPTLVGGFTPGGVSNRVWSRQGAAGR